MAGSDMNTRTCIVDREERPAEELIRFVLGPDNLVYPDLKGKLPGRGVWVGCARTKVKTAIEKGMFARGFKAKAKAEDSLPDLIAQLMEADCISTLGLAKKAGLLVTGFDKVNGLIRTGQAAAVVHSSQAAEDGVNKLAQAARAVEMPVPVIRDFDGEELDAALGLGNVTHIGLAEGKLTRKFVDLSARLRRYREI